MILVDTSIWIEFFRGKNRPIAEHLKILLDADEVTLAIPVKVEILSGSSKAMFPRLRNLLSALPICYPDQDTWNTIDLWLEDAVKSGQHFGFGDLLIAALAVRQDAMLWSLDSDFERMQQLGWLPLYKF